MTYLAQGEKLENFSNKVKDKQVRYSDLTELKTVRPRDVIESRKLFNAEIETAKKMISTGEINGQIKLDQWQKKLDALDFLEKEWRAGEIQIKLASDEYYKQTIEESKAKLRELFGEIQQKNATDIPPSSTPPTLKPGTPLVLEDPIGNPFIATRPGVSVASVTKTQRLAPGVTLSTPV